MTSYFRGSIDVIIGPISVLLMLLNKTYKNLQPEKKTENLVFGIDTGPL